jgi:hypothetical protein
MECDRIPYPLDVEIPDPAAVQKLRAALAIAC